MTDLDDFLQVHCPGCQTPLKVKTIHAGKKFKCPQCKTPVLAPSLSSAPSSSHSDSPIRDSSLEGLPPPEKELIPVICSLCDTRMYANLDQVGRRISCPDCFTYNTVPKPKKKKPKKTRPAIKETQEYQLMPADAAPTAMPKAAFDTYIAVNCGLCDTLLYGTIDQVGRKITCPDCGRLTVVPEPPKKKPKKPLSKEVTKPVPLEKPIILRQQTLDDYDTDVPEPPPLPQRPMISGVFSFPWHPGSWSHWLGISLGGIPVMLLVSITIWIIFL